MKTECGIIQDLLPLYADGVCTPESRAAVEQHLKECDTCRELHQRMTAPLPEQTEAEPDRVKEGKRFRKGLKKVRRRWAISLIAALLVAPLVLMSAAQATGDGVCFTNLGQIICGYHFLSLLKNGEYGKAFDMLDLENQWESLTDYEHYDYYGAILSEYQAIVIDGETWMFSPDTLQEYFNEIPAVLEGEAALDFWENAYQHTQVNNSLYLIPAKAYETLREQGSLPVPPDSMDQLADWALQGGVYVTDAEGNGYYVGTACGDLEVDEQIPITDDSYDFSYVPETAWKAIMEKKESERTAFEERAEQYRSMGYEEWRKKSREQFIAGMENWEEEYGRITGIRLHAAYALGTGTMLHRSLGQWQLEYTIGFSGDESGRILLWVRGGTVERVGGHSSISNFLNTLRTYYRIPDGAE